MIADITQMGGLPAGFKYCTNCGEEKETDGDFDKDSTKPDGHRDVCKACRSTLRKETEDRRRAVAHFEDMERQNLETLATLSGGGALSPHASEMLESLMEPFQGQRGFAKHLWAEYMRAPPGGQLRFKYMQMIMELVKQVSKLDLAERKLDMLDDADLVREMRKHLTSFQENLNLDENAIPVPDGGFIEIQSSEESGG